MSNNLKCWICGKNAESREHKIKKSDIVSIYGKGAYENDNEIVLIKDNKERNIPSDNSKLLKYNKILCNYCNNTRTQPFDIAYSTFIDYINRNEDLILHQRFIDFQKVYGDEFEEKQRNLFKYFVKSIGCRLAHFKHKIPKDLIDLLNQDTFQTGLVITFAVNEDKALARNNKISIDSIGNGDLFQYKNNILNYEYSEFYKWLHIFYYYNNIPQPTLGSEWIANKQCIYLGSFISNLTDEDRQKLLVDENITG